MFNEPNDANSSNRAGSDELVNFANHHTPHDALRCENETGDTMPAELEPLHQQLVTVGDEWRTRIPPADRLVAYARNVGAPHIQPDTDADAGTAAPSPQTIGRAVRHTASQPRFSPTHGPESRFRLLAAVAASLAVVALLASVFAMFAPDRFAGKRSTTPTVIRATNTPTPRPTIGPVTGDWVTPPQLSNLPNAPLMAPSDPHIIYQGGPQLKRSDNGGATWRVIPTPTFSGAAASDVTVDTSAISTLDPNTLEISIEVWISSFDPSLCPAGTQSPSIARDLALPVSSIGISGATANERTNQASFQPLQQRIPARGGMLCLAEYISRDGGAHWNKAHVPLDSYPPRGPSALQQGPYLQGQGDRLYGVKRVRPRSQTTIYPIGLRIMTTTDATNWQLIDAPLLSQGRYICDIQATPTGSTIFALTFTFNAGCYTGGTGASQIWRSDDAGAHWRLMGTLLTTTVAARLLTVSPSDTGDWLLYATVLENLHDSLRTYVSSDGGATWQQAPQAGLPAGNMEYTEVRGTLVDGSIVEAFTNAPSSSSTTGAVTLTLYAWRSGDDAWRRVSPPIRINEDWQDNTFLAIPGTPGQRNELWITESTRYAAGFTMHRFDV